jgi:hypothetical protein
VLDWIAEQEVAGAAWRVHHPQRPAVQGSGTNGRHTARTSDGTPVSTSGDAP